MANSYYFHRDSWSIDTSAPGIALSIPVVFAVVPLMGMLLLMFLPLVGFALVIYALVKKLAGPARELFATAAAPLPAAGEAHLTGHRPEEGASKAAEDALKDLEQEIASRRNS